MRSVIKLGPATMAAYLVADRIRLWEWACSRRPVHSLDLLACCYKPENWTPGDDPLRWMRA